jgi:hypothetical protein
MRKTFVPFGLLRVAMLTLCFDGLCFLENLSLVLALMCGWEKCDREARGMYEGGAGSAVEGC